MPSGISPGGRPIDETPLSASHSDNWVAKRGGLPPYVRGIARGIAKKHGGAVTSNDIQIAIGVLKNWASGQGKVHPAVRAAAAAAIARWEAMKGSADLALPMLAGPVQTVQLVDLSWSNFDAARGTTGKKGAAAKPAATGAVAGYNGPAINASTIAAIKNFQKSNGLPVTGNLDAKTLNYARTNPGAVADAKAKVTADKKAAAASKKVASAAKTANKKTANKKTAASKKAATVKKTSASKAVTAKNKANTVAKEKHNQSVANAAKAAVKKSES
jgi:hypothetical protein